LRLNQALRLAVAAAAIAFQPALAQVGAGIVAAPAAPGQSDTRVTEARTPGPRSTQARAPEPRNPDTRVLEARFRGCDPEGWCRFWIEAIDPFAQSLHRVRPDGVPRSLGDPTIAAAVRARLDVLLSSMIHQDKQILLQGLRELQDGTFAATVVVNGVDLSSDPVVRGLSERTGSPG
jgi:hypothetical protein